MRAKSGYQDAHYCSAGVVAELPLEGAGVPQNRTERDTTRCCTVQS
jgi:hypothetical protein